jgi:hypothetical protein
MSVVMFWAVVLIAVYVVHFISNSVFLRWLFKRR